MIDAQHLPTCRQLVEEVLAGSPFCCLSRSSLIEGLQVVEQLEEMVFAGAATECARLLAQAAQLPVPAFRALPVSWLVNLSDQALAQWLTLRAGELAGDRAAYPSHEAAYLLLGVAHLLNLDPLIGGSARGREDRSRHAKQDFGVT
jgi:hypothetical protein